MDRRVGIISGVAALMLTACGESATPLPPGTLAFSSSREGNWNVYLIDPQTREALRQTDSEATDWVYGAWGTTLLTVEAPASRCTPACYDLYEQDAWTGERRQINPFLLADSYLGRDPSGGGYVVARAGEDGNDLWIIHTDGTPPEPLVVRPGIDSDPDWSPDGQRILFRSDRAGAVDLFEMDLSSGDVVRLTRDPGNDGEHGYGGEGPARYSPDGERIAWMHFDRGWRVCVMTLSSAYTGCVPAGDDSLDGYPAWLPDSRHIAFSRRAGEATGLALYDLESGTVTMVDYAPRGEDYAPVWVSLPD